MKVVLVAHRGKGPTSKYTDPKEVLWRSCYEQGKLVGWIVPQNILEENDIRLPKNTPSENTIAAFRQGLEEGADAIELDIFLSKDGVPMAIHDDELNRNVSGARRAAKKKEDLGFLGNVHDYTAEELKQFDMGDGNRIPSLQEVINFVALFNKLRIKKDQQSIILNIEFKDKTEGNVEQTITVVTEAAKEGKIIKSDVIYCSFDHNSLARAMEIDQEAQVALALKTAYLFGDENVNIGAGWTVSLDTKYKASAISDLNQKITDMQGANSGKIVALDAVLWDIEPELIGLAQSHKLALHASTSDFRDFSNMVFIGNLVQMNKMVQVFFKTDEPAKIDTVLMQAYTADTLDTLDLSDTQIIDHKPVIDKSNQLDLSEVSILDAQDLQFIRLPKPGQFVPDDYSEALVKEYSEGLAEFINSKLNPISEQPIYQVQEEAITDLSGEIFSVLSGLELIQYCYWDL